MQIFVCTGFIPQPPPHTRGRLHSYGLKNTSGTCCTLFWRRNCFAATLAAGSSRKCETSTSAQARQRDAGPGDPLPQGEWPGRRTTN
eukprot:scaffold3580_cov115-Isochrysis_galbana.AAC.3